MSAKVYKIRDREAGNFLSFASNEEQALQIIEGYEEMDRSNNCFVPDFYEFVKLNKSVNSLADEYVSLLKNKDVYKPAVVEYIEDAIWQGKTYVEIRGCETSTGTPICIYFE